MIRVYRIVKKQYMQSAYSGEGACLTNGRWHSQGTSVVYTSSTISLATLEIIVHYRPLTALPEFVVVPALIPEDCVGDVAQGFAGKNLFREKQHTRAMGDRWTKHMRSVALRVPSVIVPVETNVLINPAHKDFPKIQIEQGFSLNLDERLFGRNSY